ARMGTLWGAIGMAGGSLQTTAAAPVRPRPALGRDGAADSQRLAADSPVARPRHAGNLGVRVRRSGRRCCGAAEPARSTCSRLLQAAERLPPPNLPIRRAHL